MSNVVKHRFTSPKLDGPDTTQIQPSHWNDGHTFTGGTDGQFLARDTADATYGAKWLTPATFDTVLSITTTGTVNDWAPGLNGHTTIIWNGSAPLTITGIAGGVAGQRLTIKNRGPAVIALANYSSGSAATNRFLNYVSFTSTPIAPEGSAIYVYQAGTGWDLVAHDQGAWITPAFNAADYAGASGQTWTVEAGDVVTACYRVSGRALSFLVQLSGTTIGGTPAATVSRTLFGFAAAKGIYFPYMINVNTVTTFSMANVAASGTTINFFRDLTAANWPASTNAAHFNVMGTVELL